MKPKIRDLKLQNKGVLNQEDLNRIGKRSKIRKSSFIGFEV